ncbi:PREDICTED: uncharacterized protein LOC108381399, partial [Rhagoletis zephyria]|uniref:uncharacterized protein LOC108381399 n=1 Tax=Rhagoletis zephyria TaxID=28612 RepID=UPI0008115519
QIQISFKHNLQHTNQQTAVKAKLIDFQISRYSSPVLDLVHYLYACTEKSLRDAHFHEFMQIYYDTLAQFIRDYQLDPIVLYPEAVFRQQLRQFGAYGFCMSAFSVPFFVSNASELPDLDEVSEAIQELSSSDTSDADEAESPSEKTQHKSSKNNRTISPKNQSAVELIDEYDLLTERTLPIFKKRMIGNILDLQKYEMIEAIFKC